MATDELVLDLMAEGEEAGIETTPLAEAEAAGGDGEPAGGEAGAAGGETTAAKPGQETEPKADGRQTPDAIRKHLAALKADPATAPVAKALADRIGKVRGYEEVYPTVREAREVKALIESVGGREQITTAVQSHATLERADGLLEAGDPAFAEELFKQSPEGALKVMPALLDRAAKANPQAFQEMLQPHAVAMLNGEGLPGAINALIDAFNSDNKNSLRDILGRMTNWYKGLADGAKPKAMDPDRAKFEQERTEFETSKQQAAVKQTFDANLSYSSGKIDQGLAADVKRLGLGKEAVEALRQNVWREIETRRNADAAFKAGISGKFKGKTPAADAVTYLNGFTDRAVKDAIDKVVTTYYGARKGGAAVAARVDPTAPKKAGAAAGAAQAGVTGMLRVTAAPAANDIDFDDPRTNTFKGEAVRKSDKRLVKWR